MLKELFISDVRVKLLHIFLFEADPEAGVHVRELTRLVGTEINAVRRELDRLTRIKLLTREVRGNRVYYCLRQDFPFRNELMHLLVKERPEVRVLLKHLKGLSAPSFIAVSTFYLAGERMRPGDVDLILIGSFEEHVVQAVIGKYEKAAEREIHVALLTEDDFAARKASRDLFVTQFLSQPLLMLVGDERDFYRVRQT